MAWKCTKEEGRTDGKKRQTLINMAFRHCYAVQPSLLLLFKFHFPTGFAYISLFIFFQMVE